MYLELRTITSLTDQISIEIPKWICFCLITIEYDLPFFWEWHFCNYFDDAVENVENNVHYALHMAIQPRKWIRELSQKEENK